MNQFGQIINTINDFVWGKYMLIFLVGTGIYITLGLKGRTITKIKQALKMLWAGRDKDSFGGEGDISPFQVMMTSLAGTVGTGNIAGVATAIFLGGPGAVFWMWITALFGMALKFGEAVLSVKYRIKQESGPNAGEFAGGPMYYIKNGMGESWDWLAKAFCLFTIGASLLGIGSTIQANSIARAVEKSFSIPYWLTGIILSILVYTVIIGGIKRIAEVTEKVVPIMASLYLLASLTVIFLNISELGAAFSLIFESAFSGHAAVGGFAGAAVIQVIRYGVSRGVFSNEAGLGSSAIAHGATTTDSSVKQGIVGMLGGFIDTIVICTMTALVIIMTGVWSSGATGAKLTTEAFNTGLPGSGNIVVGIGLIFFAFSTMLTWAYYGEKATEYLFGPKGIMPFRYIFVIVVFIGSITGLDLVWDLGSMMNGLMLIPNLIALLVLSPKIFEAANDYFRKEKQEQNK